MIIQNLIKDNKNNNKSTDEEKKQLVRNKIKIQSPLKSY